MTQQNAALVEQSAAAESLTEQAGRLAAVLGRFQLGAAAEQRPASALFAARAPIATPGVRPTTTPAAQARAVVVKVKQLPLTTPATKPATKLANYPANYPANKAANKPVSVPTPAGVASPAAAAADGDWETF